MMKKEQLFKQDGVYYAIVTHNVLMHDEITELGTQIFKTFFENSTFDRPIKVLDLACGGTPVSVSDMIENVEQAQFSYTGIDINPDQVGCASQLFQFSDNVVHTNFLEANAWDLLPLNLDGPFDIIFTGLNIHHGTPEEIDYLVPQLKTLLSDNGVFINHDWYRPDDEVYVRRPSWNPNDDTESYRLIAKDKIDAQTKSYEKPSVEFESFHHEWRLQFIDGLTESYRGHTQDDAGADTLKSHMLERDFPVSRQDFSDILTSHGLYHKIFNYKNSGLQIWPFMAMPVFCKNETVYQQIIKAIESN